jgi:holin-like protein
VKGRALELIVGFVLVLAFWGLGELLSNLLRLPVPGSIVGMLLLTAALRWGLITLPRVQLATDLLIRYMALFFVPPGVAFLLYLDLLRDEWLALVVGAVVGTVIVLLAVGVLQQRLERDD